MVAPLAQIANLLLILALHVRACLARLRLKLVDFGLPLVKLRLQFLLIRLFIHDVPSFRHAVRRARYLSTPGRNERGPPVSSQPRLRAVR
jgi:hypothetical protein